MNTIRLLRVLRRIFSAHYQSKVNALVTAIQDESHAKIPPISRSLIRDLVSNDEDKAKQVRLSLSQFQALDKVLVLYGEGLSFHPILEQNTPIEVLRRCRRSGRVNIIIGARTDHNEPTSVRLWDALAMNVVLEAVLDGADSSEKIGATKLIHAVAEHGVDQNLRSRKWFTPFHEPGAIVCLGSPRANPASEIMMSRMFDTIPFAHDPDPRLPFYFGWQKADIRHPSAFWIRPKDEEGEEKRLQSILGKGGKLFGIRKKGGHIIKSIFGKGARGRQEHVGVVAVERSPGGQVCFLLAGLSGPGTYAAAQMLRTIEHDFPYAVAGQSAPVLWGVVGQEVSGSPNDGEKCLFGDPHWIQKPDIWRPKTAE